MIPQEVLTEIETWEREGRSGYIKLQISRGRIVHLFRDYGVPIPSGTNGAKDNLTAPVPAQ